MTLTLLRNANVFAPEPLGMRYLLLGGGRMLGDVAARRNDRLLRWGSSSPSLRK